MTLRFQPCLLLIALAVASLALSGCQSSGPAANTSTAGTTSTHNAPNPPPPATATTERSGAQ